MDLFNNPKTIYYFVFFVLIIFFFIGIRSRDASRYQVLKKTYDHTKRKIQLQSVIKNILKERFKSMCNKWKPNMPVIYAITPTYTRPVQRAELTRLSNAFYLINNFHWIIVEDSGMKTSLVANFLNMSHLNYTHLAVGTPAKWKRKRNESKDTKYHRGVDQRNEALEWLRSNRANKENEGIVYFADDDNTYSIDLFREIRRVRGVGVWPVGLVGGFIAVKPLVNNQGKVIGWNSAWRPDRKFPIDMAGFGINLRVIRNHPKAVFSWNVPIGFQETAFLSQLTTVQQLEPMADNCTKVYVWHTRTEAPMLEGEIKLQARGLRSDMDIDEI